MRTAVALVAALALVATTAGCLLSLTKVFEFDVLAETNFGNPISISGDDSETKAIDLSAEEDYEDNKDKIKLIDRVGFEAAINNEGSTEQTFTISFRVGTGEWITLIEDMKVSAGDGNSNTVETKIGYAESEKHIRNFVLFQKAVHGGDFDLRLETGSAFELEFQHLLLIITFTVGA